MNHNRRTANAITYADANRYGTGMAQSTINIIIDRMGRNPAISDRRDAVEKGEREGTSWSADQKNFSEPGAHFRRRDRSKIIHCECIRLIIKMYTLN